MRVDLRMRIYLTGKPAETMSEIVHIGEEFARPERTMLYFVPCVGTVLINGNDIECVLRRCKGVAGWLGWASRSRGESSARIRNRFLFSGDISRRGNYLASLSGLHETSTMGQFCVAFSLFITLPHVSIGG